MSKKYKSSRNALTLPAPLRAAAPFLAAVLFFLAVCLSASGSVKAMAMLCTVLALAAVAFGFSTLRDRVALPLVMLALVVVMNGVSTAYAVSGKFALYEFLKLLISFCLVLILLALVRGEGAAPGRRIASILEWCAAIGGLVSIDLLSTRLISTPVLSFLGLFTSDYAALSGVEAGIRMTSIFTNPNIFAGYAGIGVLLSLGLVLSSEKERERMGHVVCLFINALAFVLAFSMGASGVIAVAFLVYLILEFKERRAGLFLLMAETLIVTAAATALVARTSLQAWSGMQPVPLLCVVMGAVVLCLLDKFVGRRAAKKLSAHGKTLVVIIAGVLVALIAVALAAYNLTGSITLQEGESLRRSAYPEPGEYVLAAQVSGPVTVRVESQNRQETMMHTSTVLYRGDLSEAVFTVPEDSLVVHFEFSAGQNVTLESVNYEGAEGSGSIPLGYKLLPGFIANRLQGLFANQNAIQRLVFFDDGMKLFQRSPVYGLGLGAFENGIKSVQSFYYETKYAHNHYIQVLAETGGVGLLLFVGLLLVSAAAVLLARRKEDAHPLIPALGAALVFMAGHAGVEVVFSAYAYLPMAFGVFALINLCCGSAIPTPWLNSKVKAGIQLGCCVLLVAFAFLLYGNMRAARNVKENPTFHNLTSAAKIDKFEWVDYMLSYVVNAPNVGEEQAVLAQADQYAARLAQLDSNTIPIHLAEYYFKTGRMEQGLAMVEKYVKYVSSDAAAWKSAFGLLEAYATDSEIYRAGVARVAQILEDWNAENMGDITLDEHVRAFLARMGV